MNYCGRPFFQFLRFNQTSVNVFFRWTIARGVNLGSNFVSDTKNVVYFFRNKFRQSPYRLRDRLSQDNFKRLLFPFPFTIGLITAACDDFICNCSICRSLIEVDVTCNCPSNSKATLPPIPHVSTEDPHCNTTVAKTEVPTSVRGRNPINWLQSENLSHACLMKAACELTIDSVTRVLGQAVCILNEYHSHYRHLLDLMMDLLEESRKDYSQQEFIDCKLVIIRSRMDEMKKYIDEIEMYLGCVERLAQAASETAFLGHAEYHSIAMCERLQSALTEANRIRTETRSMERQMIDLQTVCIVESGKSLK